MGMARRSMGGPLLPDEASRLHAHEEVARMALTAADIRRVCKTARLYAQVKPNVRLRWSATALSHFPAQRQYVSRLFMPDTSPTSIAWSIGGSIDVLNQLDMDVEDSEFSVGRIDDNGEWHPA